MALIFTDALFAPATIPHVQHDYSSHSSLPPLHGTFLDKGTDWFSPNVYDTPHLSVNHGIPPHTQSMPPGWKEVDWGYHAPPMPDHSVAPPIGGQHPTLPQHESDPTIFSTRLDALGTSKGFGAALHTQIPIDVSGHNIIPGAGLVVGGSYAHPHVVGGGVDVTIPIH